MTIIMLDPNPIEIGAGSFMSLAISFRVLRLNWLKGVLIESGCKIEDAV